MSTNPKTKKTTRKREYRSIPAKVKCEAVLAVWAERRKPAEVCRELGISWQQLQSWQSQALEAMMGKLESKRAQQERQRPALGARLEKLLEKAERRRNRQGKLEKRLETIQNAEAKTAEDSKGTNCTNG